MRVQVIELNLFGRLLEFLRVSSYPEWEWSEENAAEGAALHSLLVQSAGDDGGTKVVEVSA